MCITACTGMYVYYSMHRYVCVLQHVQERMSITAFTGMYVYYSMYRYVCLFVCTLSGQTTVKCMSQTSCIHENFIRENIMKYTAL